MLKVSSNAKIVISVEADFSNEKELRIKTLNCEDLHKRLFLMLEIQKAIKRDISKTQLWLHEENSPKLF